MCYTINGPCSVVSRPPQAAKIKNEWDMVSEN